MATANKKPKLYQYADERQANIHKSFPNDSFLRNEVAADHFMHWVTFFRRNFHRFAMDYLGIKLYLYQIVMLYMMGISNYFVTIASRASAKSFIVALYACIRCILYPGTLVVLASGTKGQAKLIVTEKIQKELMNMSPALNKEISNIRNNQNEVIVFFRNGSSITVVVSNQNARGYRSTCLVREEFRQIDKFVEDSVLSPFQIVRQTPYRKDKYYENNKDLIEEMVDVYISSSWFDNSSDDTWMWGVVDNAYSDMIAGKDSCLLAFDEAIAIKHEIKTMRYFQMEKKKQDPITFALEFLNVRLKENQSAFFSYKMLQQNQRSKKPFYPRTLVDYRMNKKNPYDIPKQQGEIRIVSCDIAFVENEKKNDNSIFTCMRLLPECTTYNRESADDIMIDNGYRRIIPYIESIQGGDTLKQAIRIRQLFEDFGGDYIVLDCRGGGIVLYDILAKVMYDEERDVEYSPLTCMNDENIANRIKIAGANPCIFAVVASQKMNSDIAIDFRNVLEAKKIDFLIPFEQAKEEILPNIKEYMKSPDPYEQLFYELPFLETQALINETAELVYEKKAQTGAIVISEQGNNRKDRYSSASYASMFSSLLEKDMLSNGEEYEYGIFIN